MKTGILSAIAAGLGLALSLALPAQAQAPAPAVAPTIKFALCLDLSKAYTFYTPYIVQAVKDYAQVLNKRGGIEGFQIEPLVEDTGNEPQRGIECYERLKRAGAVQTETLSTPVSMAILPRAMKDGSVFTQTTVGRPDAVDGEVFKWVFPIGITYWGMAANNVQYIKTKSNNNLKGVKIAFVYLDVPYGQQPIEVLKTLAEREGFDLKLFPYPAPGNDQAAAWAQIRRFAPDWVVHQSFASLNVIAAREMKRNGIPMDRYITAAAINELDIANIGADAKGLKRNTNYVGGDNALTREIVKELYEKGGGNGDRKNVNNTYYNLGLATYASIFEGARLAIKQYGAPLTPDKMRRGLESLRNYEANGLIAPITVTGKDHGGGGKSRIEMWDGGKWVKESEWFSAYDDLVWDIVKKQSAEYAKSNP